MDTLELIFALFDSLVAGWPHFGGCWFYLGLELDVGVAVIDLLRLFVLYLKLPSQRAPTLMLKCVDAFCLAHLNFSVLAHLFIFLFVGSYLPYELCL